MTNESHSCGIRANDGSCKHYEAKPDNWCSQRERERESHANSKALMSIWPWPTQNLSTVKHFLFARTLFCINWREHIDTKIKSSLIISYERIIEQAMKNHENKVPWFYQGQWSRENKVTRIKSVLQYLFELTPYNHLWKDRKTDKVIQSLYWKLLHFYPILSYILHPASYILHPASYILHPASYIQHPTSNIQHPTSYILHPASSILHPASYIKILSNPILSYPIQSYPAKIFKSILIETKKLRLLGFKGIHFVIYEVKRKLWVKYSAYE